MFEIIDNILIKYTENDPEVVIPEGIIAIGEKAFEAKDKLVSVKMPDSVLRIGANAFEKCTKLKNVEFSKKLERIEYEAFCRCKGLKEIELPDTLRYLGGGVFASCEKLKSVRCNSKVFEPGSDPFSNYDEKTPKGLFDKDGFLVFLNVLYKYEGNSTEVIVPEGVTRIACGVFRSGRYSWEDKNSIEKVVLPASVRYIDNAAFADCLDLKSIEMPAGIRFGENVFQGCEKLADENGFIIHDGILLAYFGSGDTINVPEGTKVIAPDIFGVGYFTNPGNKNILRVNLPEGLEEIGHGAFKNCDLLESIVIPESVHTIAYSAFAGCDHLSKVVMKGKVENMGEGVFSDCKRLADEIGFVIFNNTLFGFFGGERRVEIPEGITSIASDCFKNMGIYSVRLPSSLKKLGAAFSGCNMLEEIIIPEGVELIPRSCFSGCSRLKKAVLPSGMKQIAYGAFSDCVALESIELPDTLQDIGDNAFIGCKSIKEIRVPEGIKKLAGSAFSNCRALERASLPDTLEALGGGCFAGCSSLREIVIPAAVCSIEYDAFNGCSSLKKLVLGRLDVTVHPSAFDGCDALADKDGFTVVGDILWKYDGPGGDVVVSEGIRELAPNVFREGSSFKLRSYKSYRKTGSLKSLTLPSTLKKIGSYAMSGCIALTDIKLPEGLEAIDEGVFAESGLKNIAIPETAVTIGASLFSECKALADVLMPGIKSIPEMMFNACSALKSFNVGANVEYIADNAFSGCDSLSAIEVVSENKHYSSMDGMLINKAGDALLFCPAGKQLSSYSIPDCFTSIGSLAFRSCKTLKQINIPESVQNIGDYAFPFRDWRKKTGLETIVAHPKAGRGSIGENVFDLPDWSETPLFFPELPIHLVKEQACQLLLGLAYCQQPDKYEGEYAEIYKKYADSHEKSLLKKADSMNITAAAEYFASANKGVAKKTINYKKLGEQAKVELLEQAVVADDIEKAKEIIAGCGTFEFTARALGVACIYASLDMVKLLVENGATFDYEYSSAFKRKYGAAFSTNYSQYPVSYSSLIANHDINVYNPMIFASIKEYHFGELPQYSAKENSEETRADIAEYLCSAESAKFLAAEAMSCAILWGSTVVAERLRKLGTKLTVGALIGLTDTAASIERNEYMLCLSALPREKCLYALKTFSELLGEYDKKIILTQKSFEAENSSLIDAEVVEFVFTNTDTSKLTKSKLMELAMERDDTRALAVLVNAGTIKNTAQREKAIKFAMDNKKTESLAWLLDYKNRTSDPIAEAAKEEEKVFRELMEDPNSVSALKKKWSYKKLEDGTLQITSYKGDEEEVVIPATIGKAKVTSIGKDAFYASEYSRFKNWEARRKIRSISIPEGVTEIGENAFSLCESLETLLVPASMKKIGTGAFNRCSKLRNKEGFIIFNDVVYDYVSPKGKCDKIVITEGVKKIGEKAFYSKWSSDVLKNVQSLILPESLEEIGESAFEGLSGLKHIRLPERLHTIGRRAFAESGLEKITFSGGLKYIREAAFYATKFVELRLPESLESIGPRALYGCAKLRDLYIPASLGKIGKELLGNYGEAEGYVWNEYRPGGLYVYTPAGSAAEEHMKNYSSVFVSNDYPEE